ncbi:MAG TPA: ATP-binding protein [Ideonella sp.]|nr:ATP-binding protein [Ideonella sp.]
MKPEAAPLGWWRRHDTLALRLFLLMWVTLVLSHLAAFLLAVPLMTPGGAPPGDRLAQMPTLPSLPPGSLLGANNAAPGGPPPGTPPDGPPGAPPNTPSNAPQGPGAPMVVAAGPPALPASVLWVDYAIRLVVIALGAALGARWLAAPMKRLSRAAGTLAHGLPQGQRPPRLDEGHGSAEMREAAGVFNHMAERLAEQFDARSLHMAAISHDLRTPLTRLRMRLESLDAPEAVADIHEMNALIDSSLAVLREQRDGVPAEPIDVAALLQAMVDDLADQGQDVTADALPPARVRAHPAALRRVIGNLLGNALRYGRCARVGLRPAGPRVELWIDDDGPGIPPEQIEQAFQPWRQLGTPGARPAGHGLGLAIARDLAERDGATLTLANRPGGGLRARLDLRAA